MAHWIKISLSAGIVPLLPVQGWPGQALSVSVLSRNEPEDEELPQFPSPQVVLTGDKQLGCFGSRISGEVGSGRQPHQRVPTRRPTLLQKAFFQALQIFYRGTDVLRSGPKDPQSLGSHIFQC